MTVMKDIVELKTDHGFKEQLLNHTQIQQLRDGFADFSVFKIFWKRYVDGSPLVITMRHLCLIFQAYCLIYPVHSVNACGRTDEQKYIIPCKLPDKINGEHAYLQDNKKLFNFLF